MSFSFGNAGACRPGRFQERSLRMTRAPANPGSNRGFEGGRRAGESVVLAMPDRAKIHDRTLLAETMPLAHPFASKFRMTPLAVACNGIVAAAPGRGIHARPG